MTPPAGTERRPAVGSGWQTLLTALREELLALAPHRRLSRVDLDDHGLLRLRADVRPELRRQARRLLRAYEARLLERCELCGGPGRVYAGPVLTIRCPECAGF